MSESIAIRERMQDIASEVNDRIPVGYGFVVMCFKFNTGEDRLEYCSNGRREDVLKALQEFIDKNRNPNDWMKHS